MEKKSMIPDYLFQISWEVCNKVGGIYTVLSTAAKTFQSLNKDQVIYIGPDFGHVDNPQFKENKTLFRTWKKQAQEEGLKIRTGRWEIPGKPVAILVDFKPYMPIRNDYFYEMWEKFGVNSLQAHGDYEEVMFGYAAGKVIESFSAFHQLEKGKAVAQFHEWITASGVLYVKAHVPAVRTVFTTHATTVGRSICFNHKPLYAYFEKYNGDRMATELNVEAKHSIEKQGAAQADCFTTVSNPMAKECVQLLEKSPDIVTPNGFESDFVPKGKKYAEQHNQSRLLLKKTAEALLGYPLADDTLFIGTSGRYEYRNKGMDVFLESLGKLEQNPELKREIVAFIMVPANIAGAREDLKEKLNGDKSLDPLIHNNITHELYDYYNDDVIRTLRYFNLDNQKEKKVKVIFVPSYLDGNDGIFNQTYYDLLIGLDLTVFASYYEPWGYTPLESAAFRIPTITTDLSGFGQWVSDRPCNIENGIAVLHRTEYNYPEVAEEIQNNILLFAGKNGLQTAELGKRAFDISHKASWSEFIVYYLEAFAIALTK